MQEACPLGQGSSTLSCKARNSAVDYVDNHLPKRKRDLGWKQTSTCSDRESCWTMTTALVCSYASSCIAAQAGISQLQYCPLLEKMWNYIWFPRRLWGRIYIVFHLQHIDKLDIYFQSDITCWLYEAWHLFYEFIFFTVGYYKMIFCPV